MTRSPRVTAIVLNYKNLKDTLECLGSLAASDYDALDILFVDNGSQDGSPERVRKEFPAAKILDNQENLGYAEGNNRGLRLAFDFGADYALVLNNDTIVAPDAIRLMVQCAESDPKIGLVAPKVRSYEHRGQLHSCGTTLDWLRLRPKLAYYRQADKGQCDSIRQGIIFPGSALLMRRSLFGSIGGFDASFFLVHEDADLCLRSLKAGFMNALETKAVIYHKESRSLASDPFLQSYYSARNFLYLADLHANFMQRIAVTVGLAISLFGHGLKQLFADALQKQRSRGYLFGARDHALGRKGPYGGHK